MKKTVMLTAAAFLVTATVLAGYLDPWKKEYAASIEDPRTRVIATAHLAPTPHNMQSHRFVLPKDSPDMFFMYIDNARLLPETDPHNRQILIGNGILLYYVTIAAEESGYVADIVLLPQGEINSPEEMDTRPVAMVTLTRTGVQGNDLFDTIYKRHKNRMMYKNEPLPESLIRAIEDTSPPDSIRTVVYHKGEMVEKMQSITAKGVHREATTEGPMVETMSVFRFSKSQKEKYGYGLTLASREKSKLTLGLMEFFASKLSIGWKESGETWIKAEIPALQNTPGFIVITTHSNDQKTHLNTGRAYGSVELAAAKKGYSVQPVMQTTQEYSEMADLYREVHAIAGEGRHVAMIVRLGKAVDAVSEASPGIDVNRIVTIR